MALTPLSLTEQQMQPLARSRKSETDSLFWEMVRDFSMSVEGPNSGVFFCEIVLVLLVLGGFGGIPFKMTAIFLPWRAVRM